MRRAVATIPGVSVSFGQPISHRIDHMISGSKTNLAVKIFGPDLSVLRGLSATAERLLRDVPGIVDLSNQEQASVPQLLRGLRPSGHGPARPHAGRHGAVRGGALPGHGGGRGGRGRPHVAGDGPLPGEAPAPPRRPRGAPGHDPGRPGHPARRGGARPLRPRARPRPAGERAAPRDGHGQRRGERPRRRGREGARGPARGAVPAGGLPGRLRWAVRGGRAEPPEPRGCWRWPSSPGCTRSSTSRSAATATRSSSWSTCRSRSSAVSLAVAASGDGLSVALARRLHHALRDRHPQRRAAGEPLRAPDAGRGPAAAGGGRARLARAARARADDGAHGRTGARTPRARGRRARATRSRARWPR